MQLQKIYRLASQWVFLAYNDSPFKEILAGGIAVLSTDFERMGAEIADMIQNRY